MAPGDEQIIAAEWLVYGLHPDDAEHMAMMGRSVADFKNDIKQAREDSAEQDWECVRITAIGLGNWAADFASREKRMQILNDERLALALSEGKADACGDYVYEFKHEADSTTQSINTDASSAKLPPQHHDVFSVFRSSRSFPEFILAREERIRHTRLARRWLKTLPSDSRAVFLDRIVACVSMFAEGSALNARIRLPEWARQLKNEGNLLPVARFVADRAVNEAFTFVNYSRICPLDVRYLVDVFALLLVVPTMYSVLIDEMCEMQYWGHAYPYNDKTLLQYVYLTLDHRHRFKEGQEGIMAGIADNLLMAYDKYSHSVFEIHRRRHLLVQPSKPTNDFMLEVVCFIRKMLSCIDFVYKRNWLRTRDKKIREDVWRIGLLHNCFCGSEFCNKCQLQTHILRTLFEKSNVTLM